MIYIDQTPNPSGAYPNAKNQPFSGCIELTDEQAAVFFEYNGFVVVTEKNGAAVTVKPNVAAWEEWKDSLPELEPDQDPVAASVWDELDAAYKKGVDSAYDE